MQQSGDGCQQKSGKCTQIRDKHQNTGNHADSEAGIQSDQHQPDPVHQPHNQHYHQLSAQELAQNFIHIAGDARISVDKAARHQRADAVRPAFPVQKEIIQQERQQYQVAHAADDVAALAHQRRHPSLERVAQFARMRLQPFDHRILIDMHIIARHMVQPRQQPVLRKIDDLGNAADHIVKLVDQHRHDNQHQRQQQQQSEYHHHHGRRAAFNPFFLQPFHQRIQHISQYRRHNKRRQDVAQRVQQPNKSRNHAAHNDPRLHAARFFLIHKTFPCVFQREPPQSFSDDP